MKMIPTIAALIAAAAFPAIATAQTRSSVAVTYADLDLGSPSGIAALESRVAGAVRRICGRPQSPAVVERADHQRCLRDAAGEARAHARVLIARAQNDRVLAAR